MDNRMKMSKYNLIVTDEEDNLLIYNFLKGLSSITIVKKEDVDDFKKLFVLPDKIEKDTVENYKAITDVLRNSGILVYADINEDLLLEESQYSDVFDNKLTLTILPTGKCNFRCPYCFETPQPFSRATMSEEAQNAIIKYVQRNISKYQSLHISWFGGEPLVAPDVIKRLSESFINICDKRFVTYSADAVTNGYFLNGDMFDTLYNFRVYEYMITLDGFKEQHDRRRFTSTGGGSFDIIMDNLRKIRDNKHYRFVNIMIRVNMSQGFLETMDRFVDFLAREFGEDQRFKLMFVPVVKFANSDFPDEEIYHDYNELFSRLNHNEAYLRYFKDKGSSISSIVAKDKCPSSLKNTYLITPDLSILKCNAHYGMNENQIGHMDLKGNMILDDTLHKCWYMTKRIIKNTDDRCKECFYLPCCVENYSGCPAGFIHGKTKRKYISCPLDNKDYMNNLIKTIKYAAKNYKVTQIKLG